MPCSGRSRVSVRRLHRCDFDGCGESVEIVCDREEPTIVLRDGHGFVTPRGWTAVVTQGEKQPSDKRDVYGAPSPDGPNDHYYEVCATHRDLFVGRLLVDTRYVSVRVVTIPKVKP